MRTPHLIPQSLAVGLAVGLACAVAHAAPAYTYASQAMPIGVAHIESGTEPVLGPRLAPAAGTSVGLAGPGFRPSSIAYEIIRPDPAPARLHQVELVGFGTNAALVQLAQQQLLQAHLPAMKQATKIELVGHTDSTGRALGNEVLGHRRADAIHQFVVAQKISITGERSAGQLEPLADNASALGQAINRRVTLQYVAP